MQLSSVWSCFSFSIALACCLIFNSNVANAQFTANSLAELRSLAATHNNATITLAAGTFWIDGDHIADPTNSEPIFLELGGIGNTYDLSAATIKLDTRKLDGFGRNLGHDSGVEVIKITGSNNTVRGINLIGEDVDLDSDPNAQRHADWATVFVEVNGSGNTVDGANIVTSGSREDSYGLGDAFGKGASQGIQPFIAHRKASAFRVGDASDTVVNDIHLQVNSFGHGFFVQNSTDTTLTNSTVTGELFSSQGVIDHELYQEHGHTYYGNPIHDNIQISGAEDGVRVYTGASGFTVDNVSVTNMRTGFAVTHDGGDVTISNSTAVGVESGFDVGNNTTILNSQADISNGPALWFPSSSQNSNNQVEIELIGDQPVGVNWTAAYINGNGVDVTISRDPNASALPEESYVRLGQMFFEDWRNSNSPTGPDDNNPIPLVNSRFVNDTDQTLVMGEDVSNNVGSSRGAVISNGKDNYYDGLTLVKSGTRLTAVHKYGMGNNGYQLGAAFDSNGDIVYNGTATSDTYLDNSTVVEDGATLEIAALSNQVQIVDELVTISGDGVDGLGAIYTDGTNDNRTRLVGSGNNEVIRLDGDASIGVGLEDHFLLVGRIGGQGNLTKRGAGNVSMEKSNVFDGDLHIEEGGVVARTAAINTNLTVDSGAWVGAIGGQALRMGDGNLELNGTLDLNYRTDNNSIENLIGRLNGTGAAISSNPTSTAEGTLEIAGDADDGDGVFGGAIESRVNVLKSGSNTQIFNGNSTYSGTTTIEAGSLLVNGSHTGGGDYNIDGGSLGGGGSIASDVHLNSGAISPGQVSTTATTLTIDGSFTQNSGTTVALRTYGNASDRLAILGTASLGGNLSLGSTDASQLQIGQNLILVSAAQGVSGEFASVDGVSIGDVAGLNSGLAVLYSSDEVSARVSIMGDADFSNRVDNADIGVVFANFGAVADPLWTDGNFDGDDVVSNSDIGTVFANFGSDINSKSFFSHAFKDDSLATLIYDAKTGEVTLDGSDAIGGAITNFVLEGEFVNFDDVANPFDSLFFVSESGEISASDGLAAGSSLIELGAILDTNLSRKELEQMLATSTYVGSLGTGQFEFNFVVSVPEPASAVLLIFAATLVSARRKRNVKFVKH